MTFQFFDPEADVYITARKLPHWEQAGGTYFITFRAKDSLPRPVMIRLTWERNEWLRARGIHVEDPEWRVQIRKLSRADQRTYYEMFTGRWMDLLDDCHGECLLRQSRFSALVAESLLFFDGDRYVMGDFVVMPNHVHLLVQFPAVGPLRKQCRSWKRFTATQINKVLGRNGEFWQEESFDHLVRSAEQYEWLRKYLADNPVKAGLREGEYFYYRSPH
ncbi:MAG: transposase [Pirellulaceae bacterium]